MAAKFKQLEGSRIRGGIEECGTQVLRPLRFFVSDAGTCFSTVRCFWCCVVSLFFPEKVFSMHAQCFMLGGSSI